MECDIIKKINNNYKEQDDKEVIIMLKLLLAKDLITEAEFEMCIIKVKRIYGTKV